MEHIHTWHNADYAPGMIECSCGQTAMPDCAGSFDNEARELRDQAIECVLGVYYGWE